MGTFERYLSVWVGLAMALGVGAGLLQPGLFQFIGDLQVGGINLVIAVLIWLMIYPMMVQVEFTEVRNCFVKPKGLIVTLAMNWLVKPFTMRHWLCCSCAICLPPSFRLLLPINTSLA